MPKPDDDVLLTTVQVARRYALHPRTVQRHVRSGDLPAVRLGRVLRYRPADVAAYLDRAAATVAAR
jgi:excisionase family DNA binding protein